MNLSGKRRGLRSLDIQFGAWPFMAVEGLHHEFDHEPVRGSSRSFTVFPNRPHCSGVTRKTLADVSAIDLPASPEQIPPP